MHTGKMSTCSLGKAGDMGSIPEWGRPPGEGSGNPLQYSSLANPTDRGAWRATVHVHGVANGWLWLSEHTHTVKRQGYRHSVHMRDPALCPRPHNVLSAAHLLCLLEGPVLEHISQLNFWAWLLQFLWKYCWAIRSEKLVNTVDR